MPPQETDEVHQNRGDESLDERMFGTTDVQDAIAHGTAYIPPDHFYEIEIAGKPSRTGNSQNCNTRHFASGSAKIRRGEETASTPRRAMMPSHTSFSVPERCPCIPESSSHCSPPR
jgi:hypothetical protein